MSWKSCFLVDPGGLGGTPNEIIVAKRHVPVSLGTEVNLPSGATPGSSGRSWRPSVRQFACLQPRDC
jgi:hypothetical protein